MEVTICSDTLYSELLDILGWAALLENFNQQKTVDGLFLLSHYRSLKTHLKVLPESSYQTSSLVSEVTLLVDGLLADGEVFKALDTRICINAVSWTTSFGNSSRLTNLRGTSQTW